MLWKTIVAIVLAIGAALLTHSATVATHSTSDNPVSALSMRRFTGGILPNRGVCS